MSVDTPKGPDFFVDMMVGYRTAVVVLTANELGIFDALKETPRNSQEISLRLGCHPEGMHALLTACAALGLLSLRDGKFALNDFSERYLIKDSANYTGINLRYQQKIQTAWADLANIVRTGAPPKALMNLVQNEPDFAREYVLGVHRVSEPAAGHVAATLAKETTRMLDVGGGVGTYSIACARENPQLHAEILDLAPTLLVTKDVVRDSGVADRISLRTGNYLEDDFGKDLDLILISHVSHDESPSANRLLLKKAFAALRPGGRVAIHDFVVNADGTRPLFGTLFSLHLLTYTNGGRLYSLEEYRAFLQETGFALKSEEPVLADKIKNSTFLIVGEKN